MTKHSEARQLIGELLGLLGTAMVVGALILFVAHWAMVVVTQYGIVGLATLFSFLGTFCITLGYYLNPEV